MDCARTLQVSLLAARNMDILFCLFMADRYRGKYLQKKAARRAGRDGIATNLLSSFEDTVHSHHAVDQKPVAGITAPTVASLAWTTGVFRPNEPISMARGQEGFLNIRRKFRSFYFSKLRQVWKPPLVFRVAKKWAINVLPDPLPR